MSKPIRGKVARILNSKELALNLGAEDGVRIGMYFDILDPIGEDITDPDTGEVIGSLERPKVRVKIIRVQERLSVATTYRKKKINVGGAGLGSTPRFAGSALTGLFLPPEFLTWQETLKTQEKTWEDLSEENSYVKTGDPAVQVMEQVDETVTVESS
jgi:hypothetical protein